MSKIKNNITKYIFVEGNNRDNIFIAGPGRSGTTYLSRFLADNLKYRLIFEPFWNLHIKKDNIDDFFHHRFIEKNDTRYDNEILSVLSARYNIFKRTSYRHNGFGPFKGVIIKDICSNLFLEKIH